MSEGELEAEERQVNDAEYKNSWLARRGDLQEQIAQLEDEIKQKASDLAALKVILGGLDQLQSGTPAMREHLNSLFTTGFGIDHVPSVPARAEVQKEAIRLAMKRWTDENQDRHGGAMVTLTEATGLSPRKMKGTAGQVVQVLWHALEPLTKTDLVAEFRHFFAYDRAIADKTDGAITQAAYRAVKYGTVVQLPDGRFAAAPDSYRDANLGLVDYGDDDDDDSGR